LYTPPVTPREFATLEVGEVTLREEPAAESGANDWGEVVTRYPYRKVGMDHLLSMEKKALKLFSFESILKKIKGFNFFDVILLKPLIFFNC